MVLNITYKIKPETERRQARFIPETTLPFGQLRTDHIFLMDYENSRWANPRIVPYQNLSIAPGAVGLHYGQTIFEGAKAFKHDNGELYTFRLEENAKRFNESAGIMCMPQIPLEDQLQAIHSILDVDRLWFPEQEGACFYIRPFMVGTQDTLGVKPSKNFTYSVFLSPSGPYYSNKGFSEPIKLLITKQFHRTSPGSSGTAKAGGNYGASMRAAKSAEKLGAKQVLYLDVTNRYIEEAGAMNHYHITDKGEIIIPEFTDTILKSITSRSILELFPNARQEQISLEDFLDSLERGSIVEAGGLGTAAVVSPVGSYIFDDGREIKVGNGKIGPLSRKMYETITGIQRGGITPPDGWMRKVEKIH